MSKCKVVKQFKFEAAHQLPNHSGQCRRLHGHSYLLEICVSGPVLPPNGSSSEGMVIDFSDLGNLVKEQIIGRVDHYNLNDVVPNKYQPTTAENIASWIFHELEFHLNLHSARIEWVRIWETSTAYAEVSRENIEQ